MKRPGDVAWLGWELKRSEQTCIFSLFWDHHLEHSAPVRIRMQATGSHMASPPPALSDLSVWFLKDGGRWHNQQAGCEQAWSAGCYCSKMYRKSLWELCGRLYSVSLRVPASVHIGCMCMYICRYLHVWLGAYMSLGNHLCVNFWTLQRYLSTRSCIIMPTRVSFFLVENQNPRKFSYTWEIFIFNVMEIKYRI